MTTIKKKYKNLSFWIRCLSLFLGTTLLLVNIYGLTQDLRPKGLTPDVLRFGEQDLKLSPAELREAIVRKSNESDKEYATRLTYKLADGIAHVEWENYDPDLYHQRVPFWENYILYLMGVLTPIPEYRRYHFSNPYRSIERGIGICGDASMTLSGLLDDQGIDNKIITLPGHVMVEASFNGEKRVLDADFGVVLDNGIDYFRKKPNELILEFQNTRGKVNDGELFIAKKLSESGYKVWNGTQHFITKKYYFEKLAYIFKWFFPIALIVLALLRCRSVITSTPF